MSEEQSAATTPANPVEPEVTFRPYWGWVLLTARREVVMGSMVTFNDDTPVVSVEEFMKAAFLNPQYTIESWPTRKSKYGAPRRGRRVSNVVAEFGHIRTFWATVEALVAIAAADKYLTPQQETVKHYRTFEQVMFGRRIHDIRLYPAGQYDTEAMRERRRFHRAYQKLLGESIQNKKLDLLDRMASKWQQRGFARGLAEVLGRFDLRATRRFIEFQNDMKGYDQQRIDAIKADVRQYDSPLFAVVRRARTGTYYLHNYCYSVDELFKSFDGARCENGYDRFAILAATPDSPQVRFMQAQSPEAFEFMMELGRSRNASMMYKQPANVGKSNVDPFFNLVLCPRTDEDRRRDSKVQAA